MKKRWILLAFLALAALVPLAAAPSAAQLAVVKAYDGQVFSIKGLVAGETNSNGWTPYTWTEGRTLWAKGTVIAVVLPDGTEIYRLAADSYRYRFPDGRVIASTPSTRHLEWNLGVGDEAPDFTLEKADGSGKVHLKDLRGQVVLLDFWASWCGPCRQSLPGTEVLHKRYTPQGLKVVGVNIEGDLALAKKTIADLKLTFPTVMAAAGSDGFDWDSVQIADYEIDSIPRNILVDRMGVIRANETILDDEDLIRRVLAE